MSTLVPRPGDSAAAAGSETSPRFWSLAYFVLTVALGGLFVWTLFPGIEIRTSLLLIFLALLVLTLKRWTGALLLAIVQLHLFYFDPRDRLSLMSTGSFFWVFFAVVLVLAVSRYRTLQDHDRQSVGKTFGHLWRFLRRPDAAVAQNLMGNLIQVSIQLVKASVIIAFSAYVAWYLLASEPLNPRANGFTIREYRLIPSGYRVIMLGLKIFSIVLVSWIAVNEIVWRSLSPKQAGVYLRSTFLNWIHRDFRMVVKRRLKSRRKNTRGIEPVKSGKPDSSSEPQWDPSQATEQKD